MSSSAPLTAPSPTQRWKAGLRHRFAHIWPRGARLWVPDLWIRLPEWTASSEGVGRNKVAALTFDDGPTERGASELLEALGRWNVPATFFLLGEQVRKFPSQARELTAAGHAVGNHFRRHVHARKVSRRELVREMTEGGRILEDVLGVSPRWCRPPYGVLTHTVVKWSRVHRQQVVLWDVFPPDYLSWSTAESLESVLLRRLAPGSIVCLHDNAASARSTPALLRSVLPRLLDDGWRFVTLPDPV